MLVLSVFEAVWCDKAASLDPALGPTVENTQPQTGTHKPSGCTQIILELPADFKLVCVMINPPAVPYLTQ